MLRTYGSPSLPGLDSVSLKPNRGEGLDSLAAALAVAVEAEEVEGGDEGDPDHAGAGGDGARHAAPRLRAEPLVQLARLHPLELHLPRLPQQRRLHRHRHRPDYHVRHHLHTQHYLTFYKLTHSFIFTEYKS